MTVAPQSTTQRVRRLMPAFALFTLFLLPIVGTTVLQYFPDWVPQGRTNHGKLLQPTPALPNLPLTTADGRRTSTAELKNKWNLVWFAQGKCGDHCAELLPRLGQVQLALGKDAARVRPVVLSLDQAQFTTPAFATVPPGTLLLGVEPNGHRALLDAVQALPDQDALYIIDPAGNVVLRFAFDAPPKGILKDLERLLKYSWLG